MNLVKTIGNGINDIAFSVTRFALRNWGLIIVGVLTLVVFAAVTAALIFFWPAAIGVLAGLSATLPLIGVVSLGFLNTLAIPAAAAVVGAAAAGATFALGLGFTALVWIYKKIDAYIEKMAFKWEPVNRKHDLDETIMSGTPSCLGTLCNSSKKSPTVRGSASEGEKFQYVFRGKRSVPNQKPSSTDEEMLKDEAPKCCF